MEHAKHYNQAEKAGKRPPSIEEFFGEPVTVPDWIENLGPDNESEERRPSSRRVLPGAAGPRWRGGS